MRNRLQSILAVVLILTVSPVATAYADSNSIETVSDLLAIYNKNYSATLTNVDKEYLAAKKEYDLKFNDVQNSEIYNKMYESAESYKNELQDDVMEEINVVMGENKEISSNIAANFTGDINELRALDSRYKVNVDNINMLLVEHDKYTLDGRREIDYSGLDESQQELEGMKIRFEVPDINPVIGNVSNVKLPVGIEASITALYGSRVNPVMSSGIEFHSGVDIEVPLHTDALALFNGTVKGTGYNPTGGYFIAIDHGGGVSTYYSHLSEIRCAVGDKVKQYDVIGLTGSSGTGTIIPQLHLGLYINGNSVDPSILLNGGL